MLDHMKDWVDPPITHHRLCFIHVPKCAGTTLARGIHSAFSPWRKARRRDVFWLSEPAAREGQKLSGRSFEETRSLLLDYALSDPTIRCVMGHLVVSPRSFRTHMENWEFVTILRNPVERWISHYFYNLNASGTYSISSDLEEFIDTPRAASLGMQYPIFLGGGASGHTCSKAEIQRTIDTVRRFSIVGRVDRLDEFVSVFHGRFGKRLRLERLNVGGQQKTARQIEALNAFLPRIREICRPDMEVFEAVFGT